MKYVLAPSILSADFKVLGEQMRLTEENGAEYLHFDVMDGMFVPSISFGLPVLASIREATRQIKDVHLMIQDPVRYVEAFKESLDVKEEQLAGLEYQAIPAWDSVGHMGLISELEDAFGIMMETDDIIDFSSFEKGMEILKKYNVEIQ